MLAINSVITNNTDPYLIIIVRPQFIVPGRKIPTQANSDLIHGFDKTCSRYSHELGSGGVPYGGVQ